MPVKNAAEDELIRQRGLHFMPHLVDALGCLGELIERDRILGGFHTPHDGLAKALRAAEAQARRAEARGATLRPHIEVLGILEHGGRVIGVHTADGVIEVLRTSSICTRCG